MSKTFSNLSRKFWEKFEKEVFDIIELALIYLKQEKDLPQNEEELNRKLYFKMIGANYELLRSDDKRGDCTPLNDSKNQPNIDDITREQRKREQKRPDFQFSRTDIHSPVSEKSVKQIIVENKRLGEPTSSNWILNENYVNNGIKRFLDFEWRYGLDAAVGAMIGYIQNMDFPTILNEVNETAKQQNLPELVCIPLKNKNSLFILEQKLKRKFPKKKFKLKHFWIDIRKNS